MASVQPAHRRVVKHRPRKQVSTTSLQAFNSLLRSPWISTNTVSFGFSHVHPSILCKRNLACTVLHCRLSNIQRSGDSWGSGNVIGGPERAQSEGNVLHTRDHTSPFNSQWPCVEGRASPGLISCSRSFLQMSPGIISAF